MTISKPLTDSTLFLDLFEKIDFEIMELPLKIAWIKRIIEGGDAPWKTILNWTVRQFGGVDFLINFDYNETTLNSNLG